MKCVFLFVVVCLVAYAVAKDTEDDEAQKEDSWWSNFKERVKIVLSKWRDDLKVLWDDVMSKAKDMRGWTSEMFDSFKKKWREWLDKRPDVPDDEKNEIETFINKLKMPTEKPTEVPKRIDP